MRKSIVAAATALAAVAAGLVVTVNARPATAAVGDVPADCQVSASAFRSDGHRLRYRYAARKPSTEALPGDKLGWVPTGLVTFLEIGDASFRSNVSLATHPTDGHIYTVDRTASLVDGVWKITKHEVTRVKSGFAGTRFLTMAWPYVYRAAGTSLYRYKFAYTNGKPTLSAPVQIPGTAWDNVRTLMYQHSAATGNADVLLGTKANGELKEWRIDYSTPVKVTSKVLKARGWASFASLHRGFCNSHPEGRALLGIKADGSASLYFDANAADGLGTDIKGGSLGALGWTEKTY